MFCFSYFLFCISNTDAVKSFEKFTLSSYGGVSLYDIEYDRQSVMHYYKLV